MELKKARNQCFSLFFFFLHQFSSIRRALSASVALLSGLKQHKPSTLFKLGHFPFFKINYILSQSIRNPLFQKGNIIFSFQYFLKLQMDEDQSLPLILIYYKIRGKAQVIRTLLCYLSFNFVELHLELIEAQRQQPEEWVVNQLKQYPINKAKLPLLVDGKQYIYGSLAISIHLCKRSQRGDLLGKNQQQMESVLRILQLLSQNQMKCKTLLLDFAQRCFSKSDKEIQQMLNFTFENVMNNSHYIREICQQLQVHHKSGFVFDDLTLVDFYFSETCFYMLGFFGKIDRQYKCSFQHFYNSVISIHLGRRSNKTYLDSMRIFACKMKTLSSYVANREYLQSYSLIFEGMSSDRMNGLKKVWAGEMKYVQ